jgi:hypothetical protein
MEEPAGVLEVEDVKGLETGIGEQLLRPRVIDQIGVERLKRRKNDRPVAGQGC